MYTDWIDACEEAADELSGASGGERNGDEDDDNYD